MDNGLDERIQEAIHGVFDGGNLDDTPENRVKQLLRDVLKEVKPERKDKQEGFPELVESDEEETPASNADFKIAIWTGRNSGFNAAITEMERKQKEIGL